MASRRDQLQSYQFRSQRVVTAFVMRETDPAHAPLRRGLGALLIGAMVAVLVAAAFGVYGIITKTGSNNWKTDGAVVVEKETGAAYVYAGGRLHPALNFASALLASGQAPPAVFRVPANSLAGTPRTTTIGIAGAPDSLPDAKHLTRAGWTVCSVETVDTTRNADTAVQLTVGGPADGSAPIGADDGILTTDSSSSALVLIWHGHRYQVDPALRVPLFADAAAVRVGPALLNSLPAGRNIATIVVPSAGQPSFAVPGRHNGDVLVAQTGSGPLYYLVYNDGVAVISQLQKDSLAGVPVQVNVADVNGLPTSSHLQQVQDDQAPPLYPPHLVAPGATGRVCALFGSNASDATAPRITVGGATVAPGVPTTGHSYTGTVLADAVSVPAGHAVLAAAQPSDGFTIGGWFLVTDTGIRYPVPSVDDARTLGYDPSRAQPVPAAVLARIPVGPALDRTDAMAPATAAAG